MILSFGLSFHSRNDKCRISGGQEVDCHGTPALTVPSVAWSEAEKGWRVPSCQMKPAIDSIRPLSYRADISVITRGYVFGRWGVICFTCGSSCKCAGHHSPCPPTLCALGKISIYRIISLPKIIRYLFFSKNMKLTWSSNKYYKQHSIKVKKAKHSFHKKCSRSPYLTLPPI